MSFIKTSSSLFTVGCVEMNWFAQSELSVIIATICQYLNLIKIIWRVKWCKRNKKNNFFYAALCMCDCMFNFLFPTQMYIHHIYDEIDSIFLSTTSKFCQNFLLKVTKKDETRFVHIMSREQISKWMMTQLIYSYMHQDRQYWIYWRWWHVCLLYIKMWV